jgi:hypothetical protein
MRIKYLIFLFLISCSSIPPEISPRLYPSVESFFEHYKQTLDIKLGKEGNYYHTLHDHIRIRKDTWDSRGPYFKEMLMYHELGHGILRRRHLNNAFLDDGCPYSIMYYKIGEACYIKHRKHYIKELFENKRGFYE